jgi:hypothetical protein
MQSGLYVRLSYSALGAISYASLQQGRHSDQAHVA